MLLLLQICGPESDGMSNTWKARDYTDQERGTVLINYRSVIKQKSDSDNLLMLMPYHSCYLTYSFSQHIKWNDLKCQVFEI